MEFSGDVSLFHVIYATSCFLIFGYWKFGFDSNFGFKTGTNGFRNEAIREFLNTFLQSYVFVASSLQFLLVAYSILLK